MKKLLFLCALAVPTLSYAQIFSLTRVSASTANATILALFDAEIQKVENEINQDLPAGDPKRLMEGMANAQVASGKGLATDYISHFDKILLGAGVGLGADLEEDKEMDSDLSGIGLTGGVQLGLNMTMFTDNKFLGLDPKKTSVMFNFMSYDLDRKFDDNEASVDILSFGVMGSYKWIDGNGNRLFGWDGVRLHTGYQYSKADIDFEGEIDEDVDETTGGGENITGTITGNPKATIKTSTHSIPLEISTGVNFLWVMSFYVGAGTDINSGTAKGEGDLNAQDSTITCNGGACGGETADVRAQANIDDTGKVDPFFLRGFAGFQLNLPYTRVYVHANKVFGTEVYSVATGLRLAF